MLDIKGDRLPGPEGVGTVISAAGGDLRELASPSVLYAIVFCHFRKRYEECFLEYMADLERAMVMEGHPDYGEFCRSLLGPLAGGQGGE